MPLPAYSNVPGPTQSTLILYHFDQLFGRDPRREDFDDLSQVTTAIEEMDRNFRCLRHSFYCLLLTPQKSVRRDGQDVTPHLRYRRDAHLFVAVTGHKGRRVGRNGTVALFSQMIKGSQIPHTQWQVGCIWPHGRLNSSRWAAELLGLATIPIYGYDPTDCGCPPFKKEVSPVAWVQVPAISVLYGYHMSVYRHAIQPLCH